VGIGVCSHDKDVTEKAVFSNVDLKAAEPSAASTSMLYSTLEIITVASMDRRAIYVAPERFEAPNWMPDGKTLLFNTNGRIEKIPVAGGTPQILDTGFATHCNNDHGISPEGTQLVISDNSQEEHRSLVYIVPIGGGAPRRIHAKSPSYWHGWSPDGKTLAVRRRAKWRFRYLRDSCVRRRREATYDRQGTGRWSGILARWKVHLFQLRTHRAHADLADARRWKRAGAG